MLVWVIINNGNPLGCYFLVPFLVSNMKLEDIILRRRAIAQMHKDDQAEATVRLYRDVLEAISHSHEPKILASAALGQRTTLEHVKTALSSLLNGLRDGDIDIKDATIIVNGIIQVLP